MKKLLAIAMLLITPTAYAELHRFYLDYALVQENLKGGEGKSDELLELLEKDEPSADFLANFWHQRGIRSCNSAVEDGKNDIINNMRKENYNVSDEEKENMMNDSLSLFVYPCVRSYYYDNWDEINKMILEQSNKHDD